MSLSLMMEQKTELTGQALEKSVSSCFRMRKLKCLWVTTRVGKSFKNLT